MKIKATIKKDGTVVNQVVDRQEHLCSKVYQVTRRLGKQLSDDEIGPECENTRTVDK
jgi:hypothetical protein